MQAPSYDIKDMIEAYGESSGFDLDYGTNLFVAREPTSPKNTVTIFDTPGFAPYLGLSETGYEYPSILIRVRNVSYTTGLELAQSLMIALHGSSNEIYNDTLYTLIAAAGDPHYLDRDDNGLFRFVCDFNIQRRPYVWLTPTFNSAEVGTSVDNSIVVTMDLILDSTSVPAITDFTLSFSGGAVTVSAIQMTAGLTTFALTLSRDIVYGETGTISYVPGTNPLQSIHDVEASAFSNETVTNNVSQGFEAEAVALFARMDTQASDAQKVLMNALILSMKTSGVWDGLDVFYNFAQETEQAALLNWKSTSYNATAIGSPTFTPLEGFTGNGTSSYITTNYSAKNNGVNYTLNNCSYGGYFRQLSTGSNGTIYADISTSRIEIIARNTYAGNRVYLNASNVNISLTMVPGMWIDSRLDSNVITRMINKSYGTGSNAAVSVPISNIEIFRGYIGEFEDGQVSLVFAGEGLVQTKGNSLTDDFETYMDANGKGVIT